jgi:hypothetical protein
LRFGRVALSHNFRAHSRGRLRVAPYFTQVQTLLSVSITKVVASGNSTPKSPSILAAKWDSQSHQSTLTISCDLTSVLIPPTSINVSSAGRFTLTSASVPPGGVTKNSVVVEGPSTDPGIYTSHNGTISGANCPPPGDSFNINFTATPVGKTRGYLYLRRNSFYSDTVNVTVGSDGLLSSSDSQSVQQITAILNELAQTAGPILTAEFAEASHSGDDQRTCYDTIVDLVKSVPYYNAYRLQPGNRFWSAYTSDDKTVSLNIQFDPLIGPTRQERIGKSVDGLVAFFPMPATATIYCSVIKPGGKGLSAKPVVLSAPTVVSLYTERHVLNPQRDFFTNPDDTFTFNAGIITGHKYTSQSPAKTIVDTITGPIRSIMPSVSVTQSTQVQSSGGKVTGTTNTSSTQTSPSKGP